MVKARDGKRGVPGRLTDEDIMLWERVTQGDQVLPGRHYSKRADGIQVHLAPLLKKPDKAALAQSTREKLVHVSRALQGTGLDKRTSTRLRRGQLAIDSRLDLHGLTQAEAKAFLAQALAIAQEKGQRCVLVITGKGLRREGGGILRAKLPQWLAEPKIRPLILASEPARPQHGGDGATYVLLRRLR
jgi:DNA-nicking Smr family endonuclease